MGKWVKHFRDEKEISGCGIVGIMNERGDPFSGEDVVVAICNMMERGNGLGAGFVRRHGLDFDVVGKILASPFWSQIERVEDADERTFLRALRMVYGSALVNGPFAVVVANSSCMIGLNDRIKLRPLVAARRGTFLYISSEEAAIRKVSTHKGALYPN